VITVDREIADARGPAAPPRKNGALVFDAPWQGRAFGMALALRSRQPYGWAELRALLEKRIARAGPADGSHYYYECWIASLEELLEERRLISAEELEQRSREYLNGERDEVF
jgi:nitrile hydratase accessory protein